MSDNQYIQDLEIKIRHLQNLLKVSEIEFEETKEKYYNLYSTLDEQVKERTALLEKTREELQEKNLWLEQKQKAILESEQRFRDLFEQSPDSIIIIAEDLSIVDANPSTTEMFKKSLPDIIKKKITGFISKTDRQELAGLIKEVLQDQERDRHKIYRLKTANNRVIEFTANPVLYGNYRHALLLLRDISLNYKTEQVIRKGKEAAEQASKAKSEFLANMSHELKTPLNAIIGFSDVMLEQETDERKSTQLDTINTSGKKLQKLLDDLITLAKLQAGHLKIVNKPTNLINLMGSLEQEYRYKNKDSNILFKNIKPGTFPKLVNIDTYSLNYVLKKLLDNAFKFTKEGSISFSLTESKRTKKSTGFKIQVSDTGIGIDSAQLETIFHPFSQGDASSTRKFEGAGIGLAIVQNLVKLMGAQLQVETAIGKGTTFSIIFKSVFYENEVSPATSEKSIKLPQPDKNISICVVDDNPVNLKLMHLILKTQFQEIHLFSSGKTLLESDEIQTCSIVILDLMMPHMDGFTTLTELRKIRRDVAVILVTAHAGSELEQKASGAGFSGIVQKPMKKEVLLDTVKKSLIPATKPGTVNTTESISESLHDCCLPENMKEMILKKWQKIVDTKVINEIQLFLDQLSGMPELSEKDRLFQWIKEIRIAVNHFDIKKMNQMLDSLPKILNSNPNH